jgi:hypothetical protein
LISEDIAWKEINKNEEICVSTADVLLSVISRKNN